MLLRSLIPKYLQLIIAEILILPQRNNDLRNTQQKIFFDALNTQNNYKSIINKYECKFYSQHGEDGILLYIFSKIGFTNKTVIEIGAGDARENNTTNLILNHHCKGLLIDGSKEYVDMARFYLNLNLNSQATDIHIEQQLVTIENINSTFEKYTISGEIDLLSIDIDGNDYWIWKEISAISPRVVVIEYNALLGPEKSVTIPYISNFNDGREIHPDYYFGASLKALTKLAEQKSYTLIGCDSSGTNAFFMRNDILNNNFQAMSPENAYFPNTSYTQDQTNQLAALNFVEV